MRISLIVAVGNNRAIGRNGELPWSLPADMRYFKEKTIGKPVIMGRKTFESILARLGRPLPERFNVVLSRNPGRLRRYPVVFAGSVREAVNAAKAGARELGCREIFVIGGASVYEKFLPYAKFVYLTLVHGYFEGDTYFPELDEGEWKEISRRDNPPDEKNKYAYSFVIFERR